MQQTKGPDTNFFGTLLFSTQRLIVKKATPHKTEGQIKIGEERRKTDRAGLYLHEAPDVLLFLQEVLVESAPVGDQLQHFTLPEEGVFALLLAPAAVAAIGERVKETTKQQRAAL